MAALLEAAFVKSRAKGAGRPSLLLDSLKCAVFIRNDERERIVLVRAKIEIEKSVLGSANLCYG